MNYEPGNNKAFTLIELVVAIAILVMVITFAGVIFKVSINSHRTAAANAEIMRKLRAITDQLNADFRGLGKNGYLIIHSEVLPGRREYANSNTLDYRADRLYYFTTGDFQTWLSPNIRSNITKVYFGHDGPSLTDPAVPASKWSLARDVRLITPGFPGGIDHDGPSYAEFKAEVAATEADAASLLTSGIPIDIQIDPNDVRRLMCRNVGEILIEWTDGTKYPDNSLAWFGFSMPRTVGIPTVIAPRPEYVPIEDIDTSVPPADYMASWTPEIPAQYWPKALKFTFTVYDSKRILEQGRLFTHIVYFGD
jgi:prepilin-type N-terminal cleavage/methylation domain-containing protein